MGHGVKRSGLKTSRKLQNQHTKISVFLSLAMNYPKRILGKQFHLQ